MLHSGILMSLMWARNASAVISGDPTNDESNAQEPNVILDGGTFKMWWLGGWNTPHINYSTSADGITWAGGSMVLDAYYHAYVLKISSTFYMYAVPTATNYQFDLYTSSDGTTWTLDTAAVFSKGAGGQWDDTEFGNICVWKEGANDWRALYEARTGSGAWKIGYATSSDGKAWTKYGSNPVISETGSVGGPNIYKDAGNNYWLWVHHSASGVLPTDEERYWSNNLTNWSKNPTYYNTLRRYTADEGVGLSVSQVADVTMVEYNNQTYIWYGANADGSSAAGHGTIKLAIAPMPLAQLVRTCEGP